MRRVGGDADVRHHGAVLLRQARHVERAGGLAVQVRGHAEDGAHRHHARAADAGNQHAVGPRAVERGQGGLGQRQVGFGQRARLAAPGRGAVHGDKAGAEALDAGKILVARRLVDTPLAPQLGGQRLDGHAVGLGAAVAAALAHGAVDEAALVRVGDLAALAQAAALGGAHLVVDQHRHAGEFAQFALHALQRAPVLHGHARGQRHAVVAARVVGHHHDAAHALGQQLGGHLRHRQLAVHRLAAGHGNEAVDQQLVGDAHLGRDGLADGQEARVEVGAVAQVGEDMRLVGERRLPDPHHALAAHVREGAGGLRPLQRGDGVAADARQRAAALGQLGGGVVRAARAEVGQAHRPALGHGGRGGALAARQAEQPRDQRGDGRRRQLARRRQARRAARARPPIRAVVLAGHAHAAQARRVEQDGLDLVLQHIALFLHHQQRLQALGEVLDGVRIERPNHADLQQPDAVGAGGGFVQPQLQQRLAHVGVALARRDDAQARRGAVERHAVEPVGARVLQRGVQLVLVQARLLRQRPVEAADVQPVGRLRGQWRGRDGVRAAHAHLHAARGLDHVGHQLEPDPAAGMAAHGDAVQAEVEDVLHVGRVEHGDAGGDQDLVRLRGLRGGLGRVVVAAQRQRAAPGRGARGVGVAQHVGAAVHAGRLAVPDAEHAVVARAGEDAHVLRAPHGGGRQVLVHAGLEVDVVRLEPLGVAPQLHVVAAQRRAAVAADEARRVAPGGHVAQALLQRQAHQRLRAGHEGPAARELVFFVQCHIRRGAGCQGCGHRVCQPPWGAVSPSLLCGAV